MELQRKLAEFISRHQITAWLMIIMGSGLLLQIIIYIVTHAVGGEGADGLYRQVISYLMIPDSGMKFISQPWSLFTYPLLSASPLFSPELTEDARAFAFSPLRLIFDGLLLWTFTRIHRQMLGEDRTRRLVILGIPILGLLTLLISALLHKGEHLHYLSGMTGLMIMFAVGLATFIPNYPIQLFLFGRVKLIWIVVVLVLLDFVSSAFITPVAISVFLGVLAGFFHVYFLKNGTDITEQIWSFYQAKDQPGKKVRVAPQKSKPQKEHTENASPGDVTQETIDIILDKINEKGYDSLSRQEKEILFRASGKADDEKA